MAVFADSMIHARLILEYQFGMNSLATIPVQVNEAGTIKPQTPDQARLAALKRQKDNVAKQIEAERDRQKIHRAQQQISQVTNPKSPSVRLSDACIDSRIIRSSFFPRCVVVSDTIPAHGDANPACPLYF